MKKIPLIQVLAAGAVAGLLVNDLAAQSRVVLQNTEGRFELLRNGAPYRVKGVGGSSHLELLAAAGGNSIRTWSTEGLGRVLDEAHKHNLTICAGLWLGHERHGFSYQDQAAVTAQLASCLETVRRYKDHPALLMWGIGNEMEGDGKNPAVWYAIDHIARECKRIDPDHPTMTVIAELGESKLQQIERFCPNIDIIGVNSYGGMTSLAQRYQASGSGKPCIITEHGPLGQWEVDKTAWGAPLEASSTAKAKLYAEGYKRLLEGLPGLCLGTYAFLWGHKQECTATWFGMLLPDGTRLGAVDAMSEAWSGKPPANRCPEITALTVDRSNHLKPGEIITARLEAADPENDPLTVQWVLRSDSMTIGVGGDAQAEETPFRDAIRGEGVRVEVAVPAGGGGYRLFAYVYDGKGGAAVANAPFHVDAPLLAAASPRAALPHTVYGDTPAVAIYVPSGYMGNTAALQLNGECPENPHSGAVCLRVDYNAPDNWGGVVWQSPPDDWKGERPGGLDLSGAIALEFWVRGAEGGEVVSFMLGIVDGDHLYRDTARAERSELRLTREWQCVRIPLNGLDLTRIKSGFAFSLAGQGRPLTFYLDDVRYVGE